jgi:predicted alpha/beta-fold hydrolase
MNLFLEVPEYGGHVGFYDAQNIAYTEKRALKFLEEIQVGTNFIS